MWRHSIWIVYIFDAYHACLYCLFENISPKKSSLKFSDWVKTFELLSLNCIYFTNFGVAVIWEMWLLFVLTLILFIYVCTLIRETCNKGAVMQIEKTLINNRLRVSKASWKFRIPTICNFAVIYPWNLLLSQKVAYSLIVSVVFSAYKQNFTAQ